MSNKGLWEEIGTVVGIIIIGIFVLAWPVLKFLAVIKYLMS